MSESAPPHINLPKWDQQDGAGGPFSPGEEVGSALLEPDVPH
jgi:hypothetical protein